MDQDEVEVHKTAKKERGQYPAILTEQAWSIKDLLYGQKITPKNFAFAGTRPEILIRTQVTKAYYKSCMDLKLSVL